MESDIIKISHLNKSFSEVKAVNDLSFRVKKGELFAFLGVNGAVYVGFTFFNRIHMLKSNMKAKIVHIHACGIK